MTEDAGFWPDGRRAWQWIARWLQNESTGSRHDDGDQALQTLTDIGVLRRLLDRVEFEAIRASRRQGRSWAEIAVRLGITRQSAWERWQDVDQPERPQRPRAATRPHAAWDTSTAATTDLDRPSAPGDDPTTAAIHAMRERRVRATVVVPNVTGRTWADARAALHKVGLVAVGPDQDDPPTAASDRPDGVVTDQSPESGAMAAPGSAVRLWIDRDGGSGVREPRRPRPDPKTGRKMRDEITDETVG